MTSIGSRAKRDENVRSFFGIWTLDFPSAIRSSGTHGAARLRTRVPFARAHTRDGVFGAHEDGEPREGERTRAVGSTRWVQRRDAGAIVRE